MKKDVIFFSIIILSIFESCSLKYGMNVQDESNVPEFVFEGVNFTRYEDGNKKMSLEAEKLEQYKNGKTTYAKDMDFKIFQENSEIQMVTNNNIQIQILEMG